MNRGIDWLFRVILKPIISYQDSERKYSDRYFHDIRLGRKPDDYYQYMLDRCYNNRYKWFLFVPLLTMVITFLMLPFIAEYLGVDQKYGSFGTISVAFLGLPLAAYVWFIRSYERNRELVREEHALWSSEFSKLMEEAADSSSKKIIQRLAAIRQLQDYLTGAKWGLNCRSNSTAIFELFSCIVDDYRRSFPMPTSPYEDLTIDEFSKLFHDSMEIREIPVLKSIGVVIRSSFPIGSPPTVSSHSLQEIHLDFIDIRGTDFRGLDLSSATMTCSNISHVDFTNTNLSSVNFSLSKGEKTLFNNVELIGATLEKCQLIGSSFIDCDMSEASVAGSGFFQVSFRNVILDEAWVSGADFSDTGITRKRLNEASWDVVPWSEEPSWGNEELYPNPF